MWKSDTGRYLPVQLFLSQICSAARQAGRINPCQRRSQDHSKEAPGCSALSVSAVPLVCHRHVPALSRMKSSRPHDCNHASSSISFERCLLLLHRTRGPVRSLPAATLQHLHSDHSITASYSLWHCQTTTEVAKSSRYLQIQGE